MNATMQMRWYAKALFARPSCISSKSLVYRCLSTIHNTPDVPQIRIPDTRPTRLQMNRRRRHALLTKITGKILFQLRSRHENSIKCTEYRIPIGSSYLTIPRKIVQDQWDFDNLPKEKRLIRLTMEVADAPRDIPWATKAIETDDAARLSIHVQHGHAAPIRLHNDTATSVVFANAWSDFILRPEEDFNLYQWQLDRFPFVGPICEVFTPSSGARSFMDPDKRRAAMSKGEPLLPQWEFRKAHIERLARYQARYKTDGTEFLPLEDPAKAFEVAMQHRSVLGSRGSLSNPW